MRDMIDILEMIIIWRKRRCVYGFTAISLHFLKRL